MPGSQGIPSGNIKIQASLAKLADAPGLGPGVRKDVRVRVSWGAQGYGGTADAQP